MLLSTKHKFIFWHIPKTAGTSIREILEPLSADLNLVFQPDWERKYVRKWMTHINYNDFKNETNDSGLRVGHYREFTFVRNPYSRMISIYNHLQTYHSNYKDEPAWSRLRPVYNSFPNFDEFLCWVETRSSDTNWERLPQTHWTGSDVTKNGVRVFRVEQLPKDWLALQDYLNLQFPDLKQLNVSGKFYADNQLTKDQKNRIYQMFSTDFEAFGYER